MPEPHPTDVPTAAAPSPADGAAAPAVSVAYYTDPLCCWSWAFEPHWQRLRRDFGPHLDVRLRMGGMIPDWTSFSDPLHDVSRPAQMAPVWMDVRRRTGAPLDERLWTTDPPASSFPACLAVRAAGLQSDAAAEALLRRLREAAMLAARNIARREVLLDVAHALAADAPGAFDAERFEADLDGEAAADAFRDDLREARYLGILRFPSLTLRRPGVPGLILTGYRPYEALREALLRLAPDLAAG